MILAETDKGEDLVCSCRDGIRLLAGHDLKVIECLLILSLPEVRHRPSQSGIGVIRLGLELLLRTLKGNLGTLSGRSWFACPADRYVDKQLVAQPRLVLLEVLLELVSVCLTRDGGYWGSSPDSAIPRATFRPQQGVQGPGSQLLLFESPLNFNLLISVNPNVQPGVVIGGFLDPEGCMKISGLTVFPDRHVPSNIDGKELVLLVPFIL